jgi:glycosyltransferase involved in cell wall biosynthesis
VKVAEVVSTFPPYHGGMGYVCLHNSLELAHRGHEVTVFTLDYGRMSYNHDPEEFRVVRLRTPLISGDGGLVPNLFPKLKDFDIVHLHFPFFGGAEYIYFSSLLRRQPYFLTYHLDVFGTTLMKKLIIEAYGPTFMRGILNRASLVGALSIDHLKTSKAARYIDWNKVVEMPNGVDSDKFSPRGKNWELVAKYGFEGKTVVLFVGNLQPFKGLHILIEAISGIKDESILLLVVGGGYAETEYKRMVEDKGLKQRVIFAGPRSHDRDLPDFYNLCDFLVLPSIRSESFGLVVLEAMASGKPVIVSDLPGPSALLEEGKEGLITKAGDPGDLRSKIVYLAHDPVLRERMGREARSKVLENYSWKKVGDKLDNVLINILNDARK